MADIFSGLFPLNLSHEHLIGTFDPELFGSSASAQRIEA